LDRVLHVEQGTGQEAADDGADDAKHDVTNDAQPLVTSDEEPGEVPGDRAENDPGNQVHECVLPSQRWCVPLVRGCPDCAAAAVAPTARRTDSPLRSHCAWCRACPEAPARGQAMPRAPSRGRVRASGYRLVVVMCLQGNRRPGALPGARLRRTVDR